MREQRARARNPIEAHQANQFLCGLYYVTDRREETRAPLRDMADLPAYPPMVRRMAGTTSGPGLADDDTMEKAHGMLSQVASRRPNA